jgi:RecB family endonuclease NucS
MIHRLLEANSEGHHRGDILSLLQLGSHHMVTTQTQPTPHEAGDLIQNGFTAQQVISIVGRCTVEYEGRTQSTLGLGDRIVLCKPDGTLLVHQPTGRDPVNWQPPGGTHETALVDDDVLVRSHRASPAEVVEIRFTEVTHVAAYALSDEQDLILTGSEDDLRQQILDDPSLLESGFQPRATERETSAGPVDIYGVDAENTPVIVELKRRRVGPDAVGQLARYVTAAERERADTRVRGILVAPSVTDRARRELAQQNLEFVALAPDDDSSTTETLDSYRSK